MLSVQPRFITAASDTLRLSNYMFVKLRSSSDLTILQNFATGKNFSIIGPNQFMPLWYKLKCDKNTLGNPLEIANYLYETGSFAAAEPDFLELTTPDAPPTEMQSIMINNPPQNQLCANDPNFSDLWGLKNNQYAGIDIDACNAWTISEGANIKVAVLDGGIDGGNLDLINNISPLSFDTVTGSSPSVVRHWHGTFVAGILGAMKNNNYQISGVAPQSKLISISTDGLSTITSIEQRANGINWAWQNGAEIINNSWTANYNSNLLNDAINNALHHGRNGLGTIVIFIAGNSSKPENPNSFGVKYPANSNSEITVVGAIRNDGSRGYFSCYGDKLDLVAPGVDIMSTSVNNTLGIASGTSFAAPHVAGISALILSINPYLSAKQVNDILEKTAKKIGSYSYTNIPSRPNGTWNNEMGYGLANAFEAVKLAQQMYSNTLDLYIKDSADDMGIEPNTTTPYMWTSDNIWIRNTNDGGLDHQNPEYNSTGTPNYISVRVINKSSVVSTGNDRLKVYWAKASTNLSYPDPWNGGVFYPGTGAEMGHLIETVSIPSLQPGQETILTIPWVVPNPSNYGNNLEQWHFCLLTRIESEDDPMTTLENTNLNANVRNNNNIAWKNITVVDLIPDRSTGIVAVANLTNATKNYILEIFVDNSETGKPIYEEAELSIKMDDVLYDAWMRGGGISENLNSTSVENKKGVTGNYVKLDNIAFNPNEIGVLKLDFNFLTQQSSPKNTFRYHVVQKDAVTNEITGGETFVIKKNQRALFEAEVEPFEPVNQNTPIVIKAINIHEPAVYNWYNSAGSLIYQGQNLEISQAVAETYKLEVISTLDGFKDYKNIEVEFNPSKIQSLGPNPANDNVNINYVLNGATSAYIMIVGYNGNITNNYLLDLTANQTTIDLSNYTTGYYTIALVVNGQIADAKTLIKH